MTYRTAIVTGASRGLGRAIATAFAARGLNVMLAARTESELSAITQTLAAEHGGKVAYTVTDLRSPSAIQSLFEAARARFGVVDVLVNSAGLQPYKPLVEWSEPEIVGTVAVNLTALILCTQAALPDMLAERQGLIINIASDLSRRYLPNMAPYVGTKFGVLGFSGSLLREVKQNGIKVCTVMPGMLDTLIPAAPERPPREAHAMHPAMVAETIANLLDQPEHVILDEILIHPMRQDF